MTEVKDFKHVSSTVIRFGDLDVAGHANNIVYLRLLETGRIDYIVDLGLWDLHEPNFTVVSVKCDFKKSAQYREEIHCGTEISAIGGKSLQVRQRIWRGEGEIVAEGHSVLVTMGPDGPVPVPDTWREAIIGLQGGLPDQPTG